MGTLKTQERRTQHWKNPCITTAREIFIRKILQYPAFLAFLNTLTTDTPFPCVPAAFQQRETGAALTGVPPRNNP